MSKEFTFTCGKFGCVATEIDPFIFNIIKEIREDVMTEYYRRYKVFPKEESQAEFIMPIQEAIEKLLSMRTEAKT